MDHWLRQLELSDVDYAAHVHRISFNERMPWLAGLHTPTEDQWFFRTRVFPACPVWGAFEKDDLVGVTTFRDDWIDQLYVLPTSQGRGIGAALLEIAKSKTVELSLWTFQRNEPARRFYEKHGFVVVQETHGSENEEREPDVLYTWRPSSECKQHRSR